MIKKYKFVFLLLILLFPVSASALPITLTSHNNSSGEIILDITGNGSSAVTVDITLGANIIADIRSLFFDVVGGISDITVNSLTDLSGFFTPDNNNVITSYTPSALSSNANLTGSGVDFDFGIEFGGQGIGGNKGDIQAISLTLTGSSIINIGDDFGVRLMSFGYIGGDREDSRKMIGSSNPVPEPATLVLFGLGLLGLTGVSRKKNQN